jgi:hypothetical protein
MIDYRFMTVGLCAILFTTVIIGGSIYSGNREAFLLFFKDGANIVVFALTISTLAVSGPPLNNYKKLVHLIAILLTFLILFANAYLNPASDFYNRALAIITISLIPLLLALIIASWFRPGLRWSNPELMFKLAVYPALGAWGSYEFLSVVVLL